MSCPLTQRQTRALETAAQRLERAAAGLRAAELEAYTAGRRHQEGLVRELSRAREDAERAVARVRGCLGTGELR